MSFETIPIEELKHSQVFFTMKVPRGGLAFLYVLIFLLIAAAVYAAFGTIDEWARASATLRPIAEVAVIRNEVPGRISDRHVGHGERVAAGEPLWSIDTTVTEAEVARLEAELVRISRELAEQNAIMESLAQGSNRVADDLPYASTQVALLFNERERLRIQAEEARVAYERADQAPVSLRRNDQVEQLNRAYRLRQLELESFLPNEIVSRTNLIRSLEAQRKEVARALIGAQQQLSQSRIVAPIGGTVELQRDFPVGEFIGSGEQLMRVVPPLSDRFRLVIGVPETEAAAIAVGQRVVLRFNGFPAAEYGSATAHVSYVPKDSEQGIGGEPVYVVRAELDQAYLTDRDGRSFP